MQSLPFCSLGTLFNFYTLAPFRLQHLRRKKKKKKAFPICHSLDAQAAYESEETQKSELKVLLKTSLIYYPSIQKDAYLHSQQNRLNPFLELIL